MAGARQVEVNEPVSAEDHEALLKHAKNSAEWYCNSSMKTSEMIRSKLRDKGYPEGEVSLASGTRVDYIEEAVSYCKSLYLLHDASDYCAIVLKEGERAGKSPMELRQKLMLKSIPSSVIAEALEDYDTVSAALSAMPKAFRSQKARKASDEREKHQAVKTSLAQKGFRFGDITEALELYLQEQ